MNKGLVLVNVLGTRPLYAYPSCSICHKKVRKLNDQEERLWCSSCLQSYTQKNVCYRYHVNLTVSDGIEIARVTVFGKCLEAFFGLSATEFCRYVQKCGGKNFLQRHDIDKMVHLAVERCFVGQIVNLAFRLTSQKSDSQSLLGNMLPASKTSNFGSKIPELLANGICRIQTGTKRKSVTDGFMEYLGHIEKNVVTNSWSTCTAGDCAHSVANIENEISLKKTDCDIFEAVSPRNLLGVSSNVNNLVLSMMSSDNESINNVEVKGDIFSEFESVQRSSCCERDRAIATENNSSESVKLGNIRTGNENLTLSDLEQSFCCTSNKDKPYIFTNIREDNPNINSCRYDVQVTSKGAQHSKCLLEKEQIKPSHPTDTQRDNCSKPDIESDMLKAVDISWDRIHSQTTCVDKCSSRQNQCKAVNSANNEFDMFDSPTSDDLDVFLAQISLTWPSEKPDRNDVNINTCMSYCKENEPYSEDAVEPNFSSTSDAVYCDQGPRTCLTSSTPSFENHIYHKTSDLGCLINSTYSPIHSRTISTPGRNCIDENDGTVPDTSAAAGKPKSELHLSSTPITHCGRVSNCLYSPTPRKTKCPKSFKGKQKTRSMLRCVLSSKKSDRCSKPSPMRNRVNVSHERKQTVLQPLNESLVASSCIPLTRPTTSPEKWTENSLLLFASGSKEDAPVWPESENLAKNSNSSHTYREKTYLEGNVLNEEFSSTCSSPLLFPPSYQVI